MNYLIDIDGTICEDIPNEEAERFPVAKVFPGAVEWVNGLYEDGHYIFFFTAREHKHFHVTYQWLEKHGFKFHSIITNKPRGGNYVWVDNLDVTAIKFTGSYDLPVPAPSVHQ
jgi:hydroxymethylpyrimidine pyrophosphatase-like HAD family hydrolase